MKKTLIHFFIILGIFIPSAVTAPNVETFSKTLQAKLAYYQGFHQHSYELLNDLAQNDPYFNQWKAYFQSALISKKHSESFKVAQKNIHKISQEDRVYYYVLALLENSSPKVVLYDHHLQWEEAFSSIDIESQASFLSRFYESELMKLQSARAFMLQMLKLLDYEHHAIALLNKPITQISPSYVDQLTAIFHSRNLSEYVEKVMSSSTVIDEKALVQLLKSSDKTYNYSSKTLFTLEKRLSSLISYQKLAHHEQNQLLSSLAQLKPSLESQKIEILLYLERAEFKKAHDILNNISMKLTVFEREYFDHLLLAKAKVSFVNEDIFSNYHHENTSVDLKQLKHQMMINENPDRALYLLKKDKLYSNWDQHLYWEAKIFLKKKDHQKAIERLNSLLSHRPYDKNVRSLLAEVLIIHFEEYGLAEKILQTRSSSSSEFDSLKALIALKKEKKSEALKFVNLSLEKGANFQVVLRCLDILSTLEQPERISACKKKFLEQTPKKWHHYIEARWNQ